MKNTKAVRSIISLVGLILSSMIIMYYWSIADITQLIRVPMQVMILVLIYIGLQLLKRNVVKKQNWWDWLYYIGLFAIALPIFFTKETNYDLTLKLAQFGVLFLAIPIFIEGYFIVKQNHS